MSLNDNLHNTQKNNFEEQKRKHDEKMKFQQDFLDLKRQMAKNTKKETRINEKKREKFMKRVLSENQLRGQVIKQQETFSRMMKQA
jgi:hypothetical protein